MNECNCTHVDWHPKYNDTLQKKVYSKDKLNIRNFHVKIGKSYKGIILSKEMVNNEFSLNCAATEYKLMRN